MSPKTFLKILIVIAIVVLIALVIWFFFFSAPQGTTNGLRGNSDGFSPLNTGTIGGVSGNTQNQGGNNSTSTGNVSGYTNPIPVLRLLSDTPIGGYTASTTGTTTLIRWIDRGRGNILEAKSNTLDISTLSNTLLPRVYTSSWNKAATAFIGATLESGATTPYYIYTEIRAVDGTSTANFAPFQLKGKRLPDNTIASATSPDRSRIFFLVKNTNGGSTGYTANFDGSKVNQIFTTPLTQLNVEWPSDNIISITTKGSASQQGFMYFVNAKTGIWNKILGPLNGLSTRTSHDGKNVIYSVTGNNKDMVTSLYNVAKAASTDAVIKTLADKCVWGNYYKDLVYCGVPFQITPGTYPDAWYDGTISTVDKIWQVNATTGETKLAAQLIGQAGRILDIFTLGLDDKDNFLLFMNKYDLSFWSLDLVRSK